MSEGALSTFRLFPGLLKTLLYRVVAVVMFVVGTRYWMDLVGLGSGAFGRFDLMPVWWQMVSPAMAVLYPVAGIGLWLLTGWGAVIWLIIAIAEAVMHLGFPELYGGRPEWLAFHALGLLLVAAMRIAYLSSRSRGRYL